MLYKTARIGYSFAARISNTFDINDDKWLTYNPITFSVKISVISQVNIINRISSASIKLVSIQKKLLIGLLV